MKASWYEDNGEANERKKMRIQSINFSGRGRRKRLKQSPLLHLETNQLPIVQLVDQVNFIIKSLTEMGIACNDRIAIVMPNSAEMIAVFLGISCTAISAPLNPRHTKQEIFSFLADLPATALVIQSGATSRAALAARERRIPVFEVAPAPNTICRFTLKGPALSSLARNRLPNPDDVALILHTSGRRRNLKRFSLLTEIFVLQRLPFEIPCA